MHMLFICLLFIVSSGSQQTASPFLSLRCLAQVSEDHLQCFSNKKKCLLIDNPSLISTTENKFTLAWLNYLNNSSQKLKIQSQQTPNIQQRLTQILDCRVKLHKKEDFFSKIKEQFCCSKQAQIFETKSISQAPSNEQTQLKSLKYENYHQVWIALIISLSIAFYAYYKMKITGLLTELANVEIKAEIKLSTYEKQIDKLEELKKIYQVYWDRVVYKIEDDVCYEHFVLQGKFLDQQVYVYAVKSEGTDIGTLKYKLNLLLSCSHKRLAKLYYYTQQQDYFLIFTEKITPLSSKNLVDHLSIKTAAVAKKTAIIEIIETVSYLEQQIELKLLPLESIQLDIVIKKQSNHQYDFKINTIPCLFRKMNFNCSEEQADTSIQQAPICLVRLDIAKLFHIILLEGKLFDHLLHQTLLKENAFGNEEYLQFLDFILYEARAIGHTHELLFKQILQHPFLWDSKRKILFLADFSNYIETHLDDTKLYRLQRHAKQHQIIQPNWIKQFHSIFASQVNIYRRYDFQSVRDLIRMIRNKLNHFHEIPRQVRNHIGKTPEGFIQYCLTIFPKLLHFAYIYTRKKKWRLHMK